jgi:hypothetical protein
MQEKKSRHDVFSQIYILGRTLRDNQRLYLGYSNIIERILQYKASELTSTGTRVELCPSVCERFESLKDWYNHIVLGTLAEATIENDILMSTASV